MNAKTELPRLEPGRVVQLPTTLLCPDPEQPRTEFDDGRLSELAADIQARGIENPIIIRSDYVIKHGERRWRAASKLGLPFVPCLLAPPNEAEEGLQAVGQLLDQAADNHHQVPLSPMDWARFLKKLTEPPYGLTHAALPALLEKRGIKMSRPYISNLIRMLALPAWCQAEIIAERMPASHAKILLSVKGATAALEALKKAYDTHVQYNLEPPDANSLRELLEETLDETYIPLEREAEFDVRTCEGCEHRLTFHSPPMSDVHHCRHKPCFDKKQAEAAAAQEAAEAAGKSTKKAKPDKDKKAARVPLPVKPNKHGIVAYGKLDYGRFKSLSKYGREFDIRTCNGCEHKKLASYDGDKEGAEPYCFDVPCFNKKQRAAQRVKGQRERLALHVDNWAAAALIARLPGNHGLIFKLMTWLALHGPVSNDSSMAVSRELDHESGRLCAKLKLKRPPDVCEAFDGGTLDTTAIAAGAVEGLRRDRGNLYWFAQHAGVTLTPDTYAINAEYLALMNKEQLVALLVACNSEPEVDEQALAKRKRQELIESCLAPAVIAKAGVPAEVAKIWQQVKPEYDDHHYEDHDYDYDDNDESEDVDAQPIDDEAE